MTSDTWERVKRVFSAARELPGGQREAYIDQHSGRSTVAREARRLLALDQDGGIATPHMPRDLVNSATERYTFFPGEVLAGRYEVIRFLARGGAGEVYEAEDRERGGPVAIKTLHADLTDANGISWLRREVQAARQIEHPNVCRVFDIVQSERAVFFTMELLPGETLAALLRREGALTERRALPIIRQVVAGLAAAHAAGVVHRDLKPGNIMIVPRPQGPPRVVIMDFGLARHTIAESATTRLTRTSLAAFGTPAYMAPEQIEGRPATPATDVYALGVMLFELLTGELPFDDVSPLSMAVRKTKEEPPRPELLAPGLRRVWSRAIRQCLDAKPERRFRDVRELLRTLETRSVSSIRWRIARKRWQAGSWRPMAAAVCVAALVVALWRWGPWPPAADAVRDWERGLYSLQVGEPVAAVRWLERSVSSERPPARAYVDLALAWHQLGMTPRAQAALDAAPWLRSTADRDFAHAAQARIRGQQAEALTLLARASSDPLRLADRAWFQKNEPARWRAAAEQRPSHPAARFHLAEAAAQAGNWSEAGREYLAAELAFQAQGNPEVARAIAARRGLRHLAAGNANQARHDLAAGVVPFASGTSACEHYVVLWSGKPDGFQDPPDAVELVAENFRQMELAKASPKLRQFDEPTSDRPMFVSFPLPRVRLCSGLAEVKIRRRRDMGADNDQVKVGAAPFEAGFAPWLIQNMWIDRPDLVERQLMLPLGAKLLAAVQAVHAEQATPTLDIFIGDDTEVDYVKVTLVY